MKVKSAAPASGFDEVLVANEPELRTERERLESGIPIPDGTYGAMLRQRRGWVLMRGAEWFSGFCYRSLVNECYRAARAGKRYRTNLRGPC